MFTLNLGKLSYVWAIFFQMGWFNHPELHPQVLNHEPRGREPPGTLGVKEIQRMKLKHLHIVILGGGNSNMFFFNLTWGNDPIWRSDIFSNWVGEKPPAKICVWWVLCLGNLRQQKKCTYVKRQAVVRCVFYCDLCWRCEGIFLDMFCQRNRWMQCGNLTLPSTLWFTASFQMMFTFLITGFITLHHST